MILIDGYPVDAALSHAPSFTSDVTQYPVESGATITDNVQPKPLMVQLECVVSDSPLADVLQARRAKGFADPAFLDRPSTEAFDFLKALWEQRSRGGVTIETEPMIYTNMVMTSFVPTYDKTTGRALRFSCSFTQITTVTNLRTRVKVAVPRTASGKKTTVKKSPVVAVNRPSADDREIFTLRGQPAAWNDEKGVYEYTAVNAPFTPDGTRTVPASDLGDYTKYDNATSEIPEEGLPDPSELGADGKPINSTYFDREADEWKNTDGSPVTQQQLDRKRSLPTQGERANEEATGFPNVAPEPWWQPSGGLGGFGG